MAKIPLLWHCPYATICEKTHTYFKLQAVLYNNLHDQFQQFALTFMGGGLVLAFVHEAYKVDKIPWCFLGFIVNVSASMRFVLFRIASDVRKFSGAFTRRDQSNIQNFLCMKQHQPQKRRREICFLYVRTNLAMWVGIVM